MNHTPNVRDVIMVTNFPFQEKGLIKLILFAISNKGIKNINIKGTPKIISSTTIILSPFNDDRKLDKLNPNKEKRIRIMRLRNK